MLNKKRAEGKGEKNERELIVTQLKETEKGRSIAVSLSDDCSTDTNVVNERQ